jgi:hypothetical protein
VWVVWVVWVGLGTPTFMIMQRTNRASMGLQAAWLWAGRHVLNSCFNEGVPGLEPHCSYNYNYCSSYTHVTHVYNWSTALMEQRTYAMIYMVKARRYLKLSSYPLSTCMVVRQPYMRTIRTR